MEFLDTERELRRLHLEKEIAIASTEKVAIKQILDEERLAGDKEESSVKDVNPVVKQELKPDISDKNIKQERSFKANLCAPPFVPGSYLMPPFEPRKADPVFMPQLQENGINTTLQKNCQPTSEAGRIELINYQSAED